MEGARGIGWQAVDFDAAESALFQLEFRALSSVLPAIKKEAA